MRFQCREKPTHLMKRRSSGDEVAFVGLVAATAGLLLYLVHAAYDGALAPVLGAGAYFAAVRGAKMLMNQNASPNMMN